MADNKLDTAEKMRAMAADIVDIASDGVTPGDTVNVLTLSLASVVGFLLANESDSFSKDRVRDLCRKIKVLASDFREASLRSSGREDDYHKS